MYFKIDIIIQINNYIMLIIMCSNNTIFFFNSVIETYYNILILSTQITLFKNYTNII